MVLILTVVKPDLFFVGQRVLFLRTGLCAKVIVKPVIYSGAATVPPNLLNNNRAPEHRTIVFLSVLIVPPIIWLVAVVSETCVDGVQIVVGVQSTSVGLDAVLSVGEHEMMNAVMLANKRMKCVGAHKFITL